MLRNILSLAAVFGILSAVASAQQNAVHSDIVERFRTTAQADSVEGQFATNLLRQIQRQNTSDVLRGLFNNFYQIAPDGLVTSEKIKTQELIQAAEQRARIMITFLAWDLDGDGKISLEEKEAFTGQKRAQLEQLFFERDINADGSVSFREMNEAAKAALERKNRGNTYSYLMMFDLNADGTVTPNEVMVAVTALSEDPALTSTPSNGTLEPTAKGRNSSLPRAVSKVCTAPAAVENEQIIVVSAHEGRTLSTVSVTGLDEETHTGRIIIEDGETPIYLYLTSQDAMIWVVSGAIERVSRVVVQKSAARNGVRAGLVGIDKKKVHFTDTKTCSPSSFGVDGGKGILAYRQIAGNIGRDPNVMLSFYDLGEVSLPSGKHSAKMGKEKNDTIILNGFRFEITPHGPRLLDDSEGQLPDNFPYGATETFREMLRFQPDGIHTINPDTVVAPGPVESYDVMPQQAGLLQLLLEQKLRYTRDGYYIIEKPIVRFPAGLAGAHSVRFILADGVPMPGGHWGHSSVFSAETGECIVSRCNR